ncbi:hypothetical protein [Candidatus Vampirococcus lugosii]|uniref:Homing endonuclease LAGLIDADG domain-containing protein n=1 Tax=Candidatus Vampirococcus lugosii TaxID=2789015 RepID=A0ABS5QLR2_9BACT|nr:hypothetical protein [Candidatus Vampirococcus lugosii]MBS8122128.1 hypothetical protein [Candidatus Vampirococcus lugosii]
MSISCDGRNYIRVRFSGTYDYDWSFFNLIDIDYKCYRYITKQGRYSQITISKQKDAIKFMNFIYSGSKFGLSRKYDKWINYEKKIK